MLALCGAASDTVMQQDVQLCSMQCVCALACGRVDFAGLLHIRPRQRAGGSAGGINACRWFVAGAMPAAVHVFLVCSAIPGCSSLSQYVHLWCCYAHGSIAHLCNMP